MITGGSRGLGREIALGLAQAGADLVLVGRERVSLDGAATAAQGLGVEVATLVGDVSIPEEAEETARRAVVEHEATAAEIAAEQGRQRPGAGSS